MKCHGALSQGSGSNETWIQGRVFRPKSFPGVGHDIFRYGVEAEPSPMNEARAVQQHIFMRVEFIWALELHNYRHTTCPLTASMVSIIPDPTLVVDAPWIPLMRLAPSMFHFASAILTELTAIKSSLITPR